MGKERQILLWLSLEKRLATRDLPMNCGNGLSVHLLNGLCDEVLKDFQ